MSLAYVVPDYHLYSPMERQNMRIEFGDDNGDIAPPNKHIPLIIETEKQRQQLRTRHRKYGINDKDRENNVLYYNKPQKLNLVYKRGEVLAYTVRKEGGWISSAGEIFYFPKWSALTEGWPNARPGQIVLFNDL